MSRASSNTYRSYARPGGGSNTAARVVPFDYVADFQITGTPGQARESVINISPDGPFTAVAISYGFDQERGRSLGQFIQQFAGTTPPGGLTLHEFGVALLDGVRVNPRFLPLVFETQSTADGLIPTRYSASALPVAQLNATPIFERLVPASPIDFFLSIVDTASGRELQDQPSFSLATLGESTGRRPFRALPVPVHLGPRTSLRMQIIERTPNVTGTLFINVIGYHEFMGGCEPPPGDADSGGTGRMIPFDYVTRLRLTGESGRRVEDEIVVDGNFTADSISYGLQTEESDIVINPQPAAGATTNLDTLRLDALPVRALVEGIRIRPNMVRFAFLAGGGGLDTVPADLANRIFETVNRPENVSFRYSLFDGSSGRDLQNQPVVNSAGLGSAGGERPFKRLAKPLRMDSSSTFRVSVEERFGRGELYVVLQGHRSVSGGGRR